MRSFPGFASASSLLLLLLAGGVHAMARKPPALAFVVDPPVVAAGKTLSVRFTTPAKIQSPRMRGGDRSAAFHAVSSGTWRALWGVGSQEAPGPKELRVEAVWRKRVLTSTVSFTVEAGTFPVSHIPLTKSQSALFTTGQLERDGKTLSALYAHPVLDEKMWDGLFVQPTTGVVSCVFGARRSYGGGPPGSGHSGADIANVEGTLVTAPAGGQVVFSGWLNSFGNTVMLEHGQGVFTYYLHMKEARVKAGEIVWTGAPLGLMGKEGLATGPHLHWSFVVSGEKVDPFEWTERVFE